MKWWKYQYPQFELLLFAIPNGGLRNVIVAKKLKAEGVKAGVADLFLAMPSNKYHGLFIEMKKEKGGVQSQAQKDFQLEVEKQGYKYFLAHGWEKAAQAINDYIGNREY